MANLGNDRLLSNPLLQKMPQNDRAWSRYQQELHKIESGTFVPTFGGFSSDPASPNVRWTRQGSIITLNFHFTTGTSDDTVFTITNFPAQLVAQQAKPILMSGFHDNTAASTETGSVIIPGPGSSILSFGLGADNFAGGGWTGAGTKGFQLGTGTDVMYSVNVF